MFRDCDFVFLQFRNAAGRTWPKTTTGTHKGLVRVAYTLSDQYSKYIFHSKYIMNNLMN